MSREVRRVPTDFDHPVGQVWSGYLRPDHLDLPPCPACIHQTGPVGVLDRVFGWSPTSSGLSREAWEIESSFYPHQVEAKGHGRIAAQRLAWHDKLTQAEVDLLVSERRLHGWRLWDWVELPEPWEEGRYGPIRWTQVRNDRPNPTAVEVNAAQRGGMVHDAVNRQILLRHRCAQAGITVECATCGGTADVGTVEQRAAYETWERTDPPAGDGWQLWETISEGSPVTPAFASPEALVRWLSTEGEWRGPRAGYAEPYRPAAAEALVRAGSSLGSLVSFGGSVVNSAREADAVELEEAFRRD